MRREGSQNIEAMHRRRGSGGLVKHAISALLAEVSENRAQLEQRDHVLFEAMSQGVLCLDNHAQILLMNAAAQAMLGLTWAEIERHDTTALETRFMPLRADGTSFPAEEYPVRVALRTGKVVSDVTMGIFNQHELAYRWINVNAIPLFRPGELEPYQVIAILQDQTELVRLHEMLETIQAMSEWRATSQAELSRSYDAADMAGHASDECPICSPRYLMGCRYFSVVRLEDETALMHPLFVQSVEHKAQWFQYLDGVSLPTFLDDPALLEHLQAGNTLSLDLPLPPEIDADLPVCSSCMVAPILTDRVLVGLVLLLQCPHSGAVPLEQYQSLLPVVTKMASSLIASQKAIQERDQARAALKEAQVELERVNAVKSDFVAMMNNEFRSALLTMQGASKTIRDGDLCIEEAREFAADIYADAQHLLHMIADQLALSCLGTRHLRLQQGWLNLNAIITDVVKRLRPTTHHLFRLQLARALPILMGDHEKLTSIVSHLLKNAIQYSPDGGEICVSSMVEGHMVHVCIRDQGVGIPAFELERLFANLTHSAIETLERHTQNLSSIREIVQMHGGELWAESSLGTGSAFHFTIPFTEHFF